MTLLTDATFRESIKALKAVQYKLKIDTIRITSDECEAREEVLGILKSIGEFHGDEINDRYREPIHR